MQKGLQKAPDGTPGAGARLFTDGHQRRGDGPDVAERDRHLLHAEAPLGMAGSRRRTRRRCWPRSMPRWQQCPACSTSSVSQSRCASTNLIAGVRAALAVKIYGDDFDELTRLSQQAASADPQGARRRRREGRSHLRLAHADRTRRDARRWRASDSHCRRVQQTVATAVGGTEVGQIFEGDARFDVVVRLPEHLRTDPAALERLPIALPGGGYVPLSEVAQMSARQRGRTRSAARTASVGWS